MPQVPYVPPPPRAPPRRRDRPSAMHREDAHARSGRLLLEAAAAGTPDGGPQQRRQPRPPPPSPPPPSAAAAAASALDRLVAVVRCALAMLEEARRPSADLLDTPVATLAYHRVAWREVVVEAEEQAAAANGGGGGGGGGYGARRARLVVCAQEVCSFDADAAPDEESTALPPPMDVGGEDDDAAAVPEEACRRLASIHWRVAPSAAVVAPRSAARRLLGGGGGAGAEGEGQGAADAASLRVELRGTSVARLRAGPASMPGGGAAGGGSGGVGGEEEEELYEIALPSLHLADPLSPDCALALKGILQVRCARSGLEARLDLARDGRVKGGALRAAPGVAAALRRPGGGGGADAAAAAAAAPAGPPAAAAAAEAPTVQVGVFKGRWDDGGEVVVECPWLRPLAALAAAAAGGGEGSAGGGGHGNGGAAAVTMPVWRSGAGRGPNQPLRPPLRAIDLRALPPMQLGRLWSAVADAAAYPTTVGAGAPAAQLAAALSARVGGLVLGRPAPRDVAGGGGGGDGKAEEQAGGADPELEAFDRAADKRAAGGRRAGGDGDEEGAEAAVAAAPRNVAPCYHAEHVAGRRLAWQLRHELLRQEVVVAGVGGGAAPDVEGA